MDLVVPRLAAEARAGQQHVIAAEGARRDGRHPAAMTSHGPADLRPTTVHSAAPNPIEHTPSTTNPAIMICGSLASSAARPLS